ncbi:thioredoxin family protein [Phragmitibacter flavus]|uniref:Thioredoxin family protein n=1 Tax=Phragmitibacter flavus TaxID=2576071 RepID=A0A5R8KDP2_9BACT|nr:thioredoxin family protein [Phragmitibacter flavus]TLD70422.1 thioredoxin family protein [Phragmitibacter flavus]
MRTLLYSAGILLLSLSSVFATKPGWDDDYEKSLAKAKEEKKMVLLDFTGSDWCGWCIKLDKEVFGKQEFKKMAREHLVLVELDYPQGRRLVRRTADQNAELKKKYEVTGYPTVILLDSEGKIVNRWGGYSETFLEELKGKLPGSASGASEEKR